MAVRVGGMLVTLLALLLLPAAASPEAFRLAGVVVGPAVAEDVYGTTASAAYAPGPEPPAVAPAVYRPEVSLRPPDRLLVAPGRPAAASLAVRNAGTVPAEVRLVSWRYGDAPWRPEIVPPDRDPVPPESLAVSFSAAGRGLGHLASGGAVAAAEPVVLAPGEGRAVTAEVRAGPVSPGERREFSLVVDLEITARQ